MAPLVWVFKLSRPGRPGRRAAGTRHPGTWRTRCSVNPLRLSARARAVRAVDQPRPLTGPDREQRGQRHPRVVPAGHRHHRSAAAPSPGASLRRPQAWAGLVFPAEPGAQVRRRPFMTGQVSSRHLATFSSSNTSSRRRRGKKKTNHSPPSGEPAHFSVRTSNPFRATSPLKSRASSGSPRSASCRPGLRRPGSRLPRSSRPNDGPQAKIRAPVREPLIRNHARSHRILQRRAKRQLPLGRRVLPLPGRATPVTIGMPTHRIGSSVLLCGGLLRCPL